MFPKISIITPNLTGSSHLETTILSVIDQKYPNLEYIVIDGGSTDGSLGIIEKHSAFINHWESEPDSGLYHAIQKGFEKSTGEIMGWVNSDDILCLNSLFSIAEIFSVNPAIMWIQGYPTVIDNQNRIVYQRPPVFSKLNFYLKDYKDGRFIQQESTFWTRTLWELAGGSISQDYRYAGDFELWIRFFNFSKLFLTSAILGSFRMRNDGQLSVLNYHNYLDECDQIIDRNFQFLSEQEMADLKRIERLRALKKILSPNSEFPGYQYFMSKLIPPPEYVNFDFHNYRFQ
jgi:glycosyltransferase involved in cell wall biosynthesis